MPKAIPQCQNPTCLNRKHLLNLKTKALRSGVWFKALQRIDRVLFDLTIRVVGNIRSTQLAKSILTLTGKLESANQVGFSMRLRTIGLPLSQKISSIAQKIGNTSAITWAFDSLFAIFLAIMNVNNY